MPVENVSTGIFLNPIPYGVNFADFKVMKAVIFDFSQDKFLVREIPIPTTGDNEVLIRVDYCGLNPVDAKIRQWKELIKEDKAYWIAGLDISGTIVQTGSQVGQWKKGNRVLCHGDMFRPYGGFAEYTVQAADTLVAHPNITADIAAATPCAGWSALRALTDKLQISSDDSIMVIGGSGGVGSFALQLAKYFGANPIITTCSSHNKEYVTSLGADYFIDYRSEEVFKRVGEITHERGVTTGLDTVGGDNDILLANTLAYEGRMVEMVRTIRPELYNQAFMRGLSFHQLSLGSGHRNGSPGKFRMLDAGKRFNALLEQGIVTIPRLETISLEQVPDALQKMLDQHTVGKIVAKI